MAKKEFKEAVNRKCVSFEPNRRVANPMFDDVTKLTEIYDCIYRKSCVNYDLKSCSVKVK